MERFDYLDLGNLTDYQVRILRTSFENVARNLNALPESRERALASTKLEESFMWAAKAIHNEVIQTAGEEGCDGQ